MLNKIYKTCIYVMISTLPVFANADQLGGTTSFFKAAKDLVTTYLIPLVFLLGLLLFFWGMVKYIWSVGQDKEAGKQIMIWGVVALFVMSSIWGIITIIRSDVLGITGNDTPMKIPSITP
jgi:SNF family Na+-dependent transporter